MPAWVAGVVVVVVAAGAGVVVAAGAGALGAAAGGLDCASAGTIITDASSPPMRSFERMEEISVWKVRELRTNAPEIFLFLELPVFR
jgi:hypothetical protein